MAQNWAFLNGVKINNEVFEFIKENSYVIVFHEDEDDDPENKKFRNITTSKKKRDLYPWVAYIPSNCRICGKNICPCSRPPVRLKSLHTFVWDFFHGATNPRRKGEDVHHKSRDKLDARIKNLGKGTKRAHALAHRSLRQKFSARKRDNLGGLFRPHLPAKVISRPELIGTIAMPEVKYPPMPSKAKKVREMEHRLGMNFFTLSVEMAHFDSGAVVTSVPSSEWRSPRTRMLGITMPKLDPSPGEAVFVMLLAKNGFDIDAVAAETGEHPDLLRALYERSAVSAAVERWRKKKVLPLALSSG